ncbi:hypothetical protein D3C86_1830970 [compost metagenome]
MVTQDQQRFNQRTGLLTRCHEQRRFGWHLFGYVNGFARQNHEAGDVLRLICQVSLQYLQSIQRTAGFAAQRRNGWRISLCDFFHRC